ncbi:T9SS type A sorting domain-containing protein [bacterium]|nr:T9SS type A sorting domain-containing protein [bacterium]
MRISRYYLVMGILMILQSVSVTAQRLQPADFQYLGAFRLPGESGGSNWMYSGQGITVFPQGDVSGPQDGFPGSLYAVGHDHHLMVSEISIPIPIISADKNLADLNTASTLQPFADITGGMFGEMEIPVAGLAYLSAQSGQTEGHLYFCRGQHIQYKEASHGWSGLDLSNPTPAGPWFFAMYNNYTSNDILFEIPKAWADEYAPGQILASGRFREGVWSGLGPALYACAPWLDGNPPLAQSQLSSITRLLLYGEDDHGIPEIITDDAHKYFNFKEADQWTGGEWLTSGSASAVIFAGTKAMGQSWYGFSNGVVWPYGGPYPSIPDPPHDERGFWADSIHAQIIFYDPEDLGKAAKGEIESYTPQPYAALDITEYLYEPGYDYWRQKRQSLGACSFDRQNQLLYILERMVQADEEKSIVHVFEIQETTSVSQFKGTPVAFSLQQNYPNPFNPETTITFQLTQTSDVKISICNLMGKVMKNYFINTLSPGSHRVSWNGTDAMDRSVSSGVYLYQMSIANGQGTSDYTDVKKMILIR